jgi:hypothetical protein
VDNAKFGKFPVTGEAGRSLAFWLIMATAGYLYVAGILNHRANPFASAPGNAWEFGKLLLAALILWLLGARHTLVAFIPPWKKVASYNGLGWVLPFFVGLHFYFIRSIIRTDISLTPAGIGRMSAYTWMVFILAAAVILGLLGYHVLLARRAGILKIWLGSMIAVVAFLVCVTVLLRGSHYVHIHHYFLFGLLVLWLRFPDRVSSACQAISAGIAVEGVATWGMDPVWYPLQ